VPDPLLSLDAITRGVDLVPPASVRSSTDGRGDATWVRIVGRLDLAAVPQLVRTLRQAQLKARLVVLDLRELQLMDSSGVHVIVNASIRARRLGGRLVLLRVPRTPTASV
jgi:anti-anti-sigma factor